MKKIVCYLLALLMLFYVCDLRAYSIAHKWGCDTIIMRGNYAELKKLEGDILVKMEAFTKGLEKGELYNLMGQIYSSMGFVNKSLEWHKKAIDWFESKKHLNNLFTPDYLYYYAQILADYASVQNFIEFDLQKAVNSYQLADDKFKELKYLWANPVWSSREDDSEYNAKKSYGHYYNCHSRACMYFRMGAYTVAKKEFDYATTWLKSFYGEQYKNTLEYADLLLLLHDLYEKIGEEEQRLKCCKEAMEIVENTIGKASLMYSSLLSRLGSFYASNLNETLSKECFSESLDIIAANGYEEHQFQIAPLLGLGFWNYQKFMEKYGTNEAELSYRKLRLYYTRAIQLNQKFVGEDSPYTILCKSHLISAQLYKSLLNGGAGFQEVLIQAFQMINSLINSNHIALRQSSIVPVTSLLYVLYFAGENDFAIRNYNEYSKTMENVGDKGFQRERRALHALMGDIYSKVGDYDNAVIQSGKALECHREIIHKVLSLLPEQQRAAFGNDIRVGVEDMLRSSEITEDQSNAMGEFMYDVALLNKNLLLQASVNLADIIYNSGDEKLKEKFQYFRMLKQELEEKGVVDSQALTDLESEILNESKKYGDFMKYTNYTWRDVQNALGNKDIAVEFVSSRDVDIIKGIIYIRYSVEVISKDMDKPRHFVLFTIPVNEVSSLMAEPGKFSQMIQDKIWSKELLELMKGKKNVYFVPDGELYNIGIEYIPIEGGKRICDIFKMHRLSSTREIVNSRKSVADLTCALYGGMNYNTSLSDMELYAYASSMRGGKSFSFSPDRTSNYTSWGYLPGTLEEVNSVSSTLKNNGYAVTAFSGSEGVEETFKALSGKKTKIIHIATHGFYLPDKGESLQNSGLVFAGANNFWDADKVNGTMDFDDGILTAKEISNLNLMGTDLVVMSACQTGLGEVTGEGVFGLQRAFKMAGAQTLLMSLWEVDDEITQLMMSEFYKALTLGHTKRQAFKRAQDKIRNHTFIRGGKEVSGNDPYYWAAFIMMD